MTSRRLRALRPARARHEAGTPTEHVRAALSGNPGDVAGQLADRAAFNSPIRKYASLRDVVHLLSLIRPVMPAARVERTWCDPDGAATQSLPAPAINLGVAFGSYAGGVAIGDFTASAPVITGLTIAVIGILAAWATSFLKPPSAGKVPGLTAAAEPTSEAV